MKSWIYSTGRTLEHDFLGDRTKEIRKADIEYANFNRAVLNAIFIKSQNPNKYSKEESVNPPAPMMQKIKSNMEQIMGDDFDIRVFNAVSTSLDVHHGVDFFVNFFDKKNGRETMVKIDITQNVDGKNISHGVADLFMSDSKIIVNLKYDFDNLEIDLSEKPDDRNREIAEVITKIAKQKMLTGNKNDGAIASSLLAMEESKNKNNEKEIDVRGNMAIEAMFGKEELEMIKSSMIHKNRQNIHRVFSRAS